MFTLGGNVFCCQGHPEFENVAMHAIFDTMKARGTMSDEELAAARLVLDAKGTESAPMRALARRLLAGERTVTLTHAAL